MRRAVLALVLAAGCGDDAAETPWVAGPSLPGPRLEPGVIAYRDAIWVIGGFDENLQVSRDVWILEDGAWRAGPEVPAALTHMNLAIAGDALFLLGGLEGRNFVPNGECWRIADETAGWEALAPMLDGRARGAAATIALDDGTILLAGGATETAAVASVDRYRVDTGAWEALADLPSPRSHPIGAHDAGGAPLVLGGLATLDATEPLDEVLALDGDGDGWRAIDPMPTARGGCAAAELDGVLYCAGGEAGNAALATVEAYDGTWTTLAPLPEPRAGAGAAGHDGALYVIGGAHRLAWQPIADVDVLVPE